MRDIGKNIKMIRISKKWTQDALAEALFVTRQTVSNYENGRSRPDLDMLLKIAEVFDTDITTIIYGPPVPQSKKVAYRQLIISGALLVFLLICYFVVSATVSKDIRFLFTSARLLNSIVLLPAVMLVLGWMLLHLLGIFCNLRQLKGKGIKWIKLTVSVVFGLWVAILVPYFVFMIVSLIHSLTSDSVHMVFPHIPIYQEIAYGILKLTINVPFLYALWGGLFWILGVPKVTVRDASSG